MELTARRNLIKIHIGSAPALPAGLPADSFTLAFARARVSRKMAGVDDHRCFNRITVSGTVWHYAVMCDLSR